MADLSRWDLPPFGSQVGALPWQGADRAPLPELSMCVVCLEVDHTAVMSGCEGCEEPGHPGCLLECERCAARYCTDCFGPRDVCRPCIAGGRRFGLVI